MGAFGADIPKEAVRVFGPEVDKHDVLDAMVRSIADTGVVKDVEALRRAVYDREAVMSTGIGQGIAIPHVRIDAVTAPAVGVGVSNSGIDFDTLDNEPVHILVLFAMPSGSQKEYLGLLAKVMTALKQPGFRDKLLACSDTDELVAVLNEG